jgi:KaiC/GvpD/RAD55 family RecA-like ATPase
MDLSQKIGIWNTLQRNHKINPEATGIIRLSSSFEGNLSNQVMIIEKIKDTPNNLKKFTPNLEK